MRWIITAAVALMPASAQASCQVRTTGETISRFMPALRSSLTADEIPSPTFSGTGNGETIFSLPGSHVGLTLVEKDGLLAEVGTDVIPPVSDKDRDTFATVAAAMVSRLSGTAERQAKDDLYAGLHTHPNPSNFLLRWGSTAASMTRAANGALVARIGKMDCD